MFYAHALVNNQPYLFRLLSRAINPTLWDQQVSKMEEHLEKTSNSKYSSYFDNSANAHSSMFT